MPAPGGPWPLLRPLRCLALSTPIVSGAGSPSRRFPAAGPDQGESAQAIVIPGGGVRRNAPEYGGDTLGRLTLERVRYGARLAKQTGLPLLVTGGSVTGNTVPEAVLMKEALEKGIQCAGCDGWKRNRATRG
ncbi:MAG: YdcF family protein, partial [Betaproteobacteria bacterium]|nr:YdcF family protein [Betaproteobacteria bacterium]